MSLYQEYHIVQKCLKQIEQRLEWGNSDDWHNDTFQKLSDRINEETNVLLSITTLKRVWGKVNNDHAPSISTLNTLAQFAGYSSWHDFKIENNIKQTEKKERIPISTQGIILVSAIVLAIVFITLFSLTGSEDLKPSIDYSKVKFTSKPVALGLPNSVIFNLDLSGIKSDSIYIQQFWDPTKTIKIKQDQHQATGIYYYPGYFHSKLLVDGSIIKEHDLFVRTPKWMATIDYEPIPRYVLDVKSDSVLKLTEKASKEVKSWSKPTFSTYHLVKDFEIINGDKMVLNTTIQNTYNDKWAVCEYVGIIILGKSGVFIIPFSIPGCVSDLGLVLNDKYYNGKENDLSAFGIELNRERNLVIKTSDKKLSVLVDGDEIYSGMYNEPIGDFVGIRYKFLGTGEVLSAKIETGQNTINLLDND